MPPRRFRASESSSEKDAKENSKKENKGKDRKKDTSEKGAKEKPKKEDTEKDGKSDTKKKPKNVEPDTEGPGKCGTKKDDDTDESGGGLDSDEANPGAMKKPSARQAGQEKCFALLASFFCAQPLTHMLFFCNAGRAKKRPAAAKSNRTKKKACNFLSKACITRFKLASAVRQKHVSFLR